MVSQPRHAPPADARPPSTERAHRQRPARRPGRGGGAATPGEHAIDATFAAAVELLAASTGRVVVTGMGKSGHVARKIAATLASTGTPAIFVHPAEASHGDLGMITAAGRGAGAVEFRRDRPSCAT